MVQPLRGEKEKQKMIKDAKKKTIEKKMMAVLEQIENYDCFIDHYTEKDGATLEIGGSLTLVEDCGYVVETRDGKIFETNCPNMVVFLVDIA